MEGWHFRFNYSICGSGLTQCGAHGGVFRAGPGNADDSHFPGALTRAQAGDGRAG